MPRYIDADVLMKLLHTDDFGTPDERWKPESEFARMIEATPTADVAEVKRGHWKTYIYKIYTCDACGKTNGRHETNYCPNCGAKMDGGEE